MKKVDVVLVYPPSVFEEKITEEGKRRRYQIGNQKLGTWPPLGIMGLAACLEEKKISCAILNPFVCDLNLKEVVERISRWAPRLVGISVTTLQVRGAVQLAEAIKKKFKQKILVCVGGPHISIDPNFVRQFRCFDFGLVGEAEITFPEVTQKVLAGRKIPKVINCQLPTDLDALPFPARHKINLKDYFSSEAPLGTILTSRGCPFHCLFCSRVAISDKVRFRNPKRVVDEMESIKEKCRNTFTFLDDTFTLNRGHTLALCEEIISRGLKFNWSCNTRASLLDFNLVKKMKAAGCSLILVGVESGNEKLRNKIINKRITNREIRQAIKICKKLGVTIGGYFMLGFPHETKEQLWETANFPGKYDFDIMSIHATTIYPGSDIFKLAEEEEGEKALPLWYQFARGEKTLEELPLAYVPQGMDFAEIEKARRAAYLKFYVRPSFILKQLRQDLHSWTDLKRDLWQALMLLRFGKTSKDLK